MTRFPVGKLPPHVLPAMLSSYTHEHPRLLLGPGIGIDCAVISHGDQLLAVKTDPVTFATEDIGWYAVHINANDVATTGATPLWFMAALLLPERGAHQQIALTGDCRRLFGHLYDNCFGLKSLVVGFNR